MQYEEMEEYKAYMKAYDEMLQAMLNMRFLWIKTPEDFLGLIALTYKTATTGRVPVLTEQEIQAGIVLPDVDVIGEVFDAWINMRYNYIRYKDFNELKQDCTPSEAIFSEKAIKGAKRRKRDFFLHQALKHTDGVHFLTYNKPAHPAALLWAEAFMLKLTARIKPHDPALVEIMLAHNIYKGAFMAI